MAPNAPEFSVSRFLWEEIFACACNPLKGCNYAPYIHHLIVEVTGINIKTDTVHKEYAPSQSQIEILCKVGSKALAPPPAPSGGPSAPSSHAPEGGEGTSQAAPSQAGPSSSKPTKKQSTLNAIASGIFACFNACKAQRQELYEQRKEFQAYRASMDRHVKEIKDKLEMPHSPYYEPAEIPLPPPIPNPWDDFAHYGGSTSYAPFGEIEEEHDLGGAEGGNGGDEEEVGDDEEDSDEEEDVPEAEGEDDDDDEDDDDEDDNEGDGGDEE